MSRLLQPKNALNIYRGASKTLRVLAEQDNVSGQGQSPFDLTGSRLLFTVKERPTDVDIIIQKTSDASTEIEITDPLGGVAKIYMDPEDTEKLNTNCRYVFDVWIVLPSGAQHVLISPTEFCVKQAVTKL